MAGDVILGGKKYAVDAPVKVLTWEDHGLTFAGAVNTRRRVQKPDLIVWHWTGGENSAFTTYQTLMQRDLGVSFCIERGGDIYQFCDPVVWDPQDMGGASGKRSISIEVANYGFQLRGGPGPARGLDRQVIVERIHGARVRCASFYPIQVSALASLTKTLCDALGIPLRFPREADGSIALRLLRAKELRGFSGIIGHFHKTDQKYDPGFQIFRDLGSLEQR